MNTHNTPITNRLRSGSELKATDVRGVQLKPVKTPTLYRLSYGGPTLPLKKEKKILWELNEQHHDHASKGNIVLMSNGHVYFTK